MTYREAMSSDPNIERAVRELISILINTLSEIRGELGAALSQSLESDDQIILNHVRNAESYISSALIILRGFK